MTIKQITAALKIYRENWESIKDVDDSPLHGLALPDFGHRTVTIQCAARFIGYHVMMLNGNVDEKALNDLAWLLRRRVTVLGV